MRLFSCGKQVLPNCFEIFGVDLLVSDDFAVSLLEINAVRPLAFPIPLCLENQSPSPSPSLSSVPRLHPNWRGTPVRHRRPLRPDAPGRRRPLLHDADGRPSARSRRSRSWGGADVENIRRAPAGSRDGSQPGLVTAFFALFPQQLDGASHFSRVQTRPIVYLMCFDAPTDQSKSGDHHAPWVRLAM